MDSTWRINRLTVLIQQIIELINLVKKCVRPWERHFRETRPFFLPFCSPGLFLVLVSCFRHGNAHFERAGGTERGPACITSRGRLPSLGNARLRILVSDSGIPLACGWPLMMTPADDAAAAGRQDGHFSRALLASAHVSCLDFSWGFLFPGLVNILLVW